MQDDISRFNRLARGDTRNLERGDDCPMCGMSTLVKDIETGEIDCTNCGFVADGLAIDRGPEWRSFSNKMDVDPSRTGAPENIAKTGMTTEIGRASTDSSGRLLSPAMMGTVRRLQILDSRSVRNPQERNLNHALPELDKLADKLSVSDAVKQKSAYMYRKALERGLVRGRSIVAVTAASLYAGCRDTLTPRTLNDIAAASNIEKKTLARCYRLLLTEMNIKMPVADATRCVSRIASPVGLSVKVQRRAMEVIRQVDEIEESAGKSPMGLAAAALYLASVLDGEVKTQKELAEAAGVSEVTVKNRYKSMLAVLNLDTQIRKEEQGREAIPPEQPKITEQHTARPEEKHKPSEPMPVESRTDIRVKTVRMRIEDYVNALDEATYPLKTVKSLARKQLESTEIEGGLRGIGSDLLAAGFVFGAGRGRLLQGVSLAEDLAFMARTTPDYIKSLWTEIQRNQKLAVTEAAPQKKQAHAKVKA